ncbi:MAP1A aminopeptidase, partial [Spelaeornis formosus]|nr:MAP1A aminopeptidase [Elachura formosa]
MEAGQVFTIEPMINLGTHNLDHWPDDWTATTMDGRRSAQFEETILITETGAEILTRMPASS